MSKPKKRINRASNIAQSTTKGSVSKKAKKSKKRYDQIVFRDWCKACGICSAFCPKGVLGRDETGAPVIEKPDECIGCRFCELHCPDFAITIIERKEKRTEQPS